MKIKDLVALLNAEDPEAEVFVAGPIGGGDWDWLVNVELRVGWRQSGTLTLCGIPPPGIGWRKPSTRP